MVVAQKPKYLRGRQIDEMDRLFTEGAESVGVTEVASYASELEAVEALVAQADPGDVIAVMCQAQRVEVDEWLRERGGTVDDPDTLRAKVLAASS